jgi:hypothetical protein
MAKEQVEWVSLEDVIVAAERNLAPIGPEMAGFIALEAAARLRELGGGVIDATYLAVGTTGHVALTAEPRRGEDAVAARTLRLMLGTLLELATSSTPALRQCARRKDAASIGSLVRELEGALIPLNRAASRRALARVARATLEAMEAGRLEPSPEREGRDDESDPPAVELATRRSEPQALVARPRVEPPPLPEVVARREDVRSVQHAALVEAGAAPAPAEPTPPPVDAEPTPFEPSPFEALEQAGPSIAELAASLEEQGPAEIEIVSHLPPIVTAMPPAVSAHEASGAGATAAVRIQTSTANKDDRVARLIDAFEVSRKRDDKALSRDIKGWIGIETATGQPPPVQVNVRMKPRHEALDIEVDVPEGGRGDADSAGAKPRRRGSLAAAFALTAVALATGLLAARPSLLDALLGKPSPPPGDIVAAAPQAAPSIAPRIPVVCEASLSVDGVPPGAEVLRRIGVTPFTITAPMNVALDLVATTEGHAPRRAHVSATATWQKDPTGARLDVPFALEATPSAKWPSTTGLVPLHAPTDASRGLLRATSAPSGASVWVVVDPQAIGGIPCGGPVELMVVPSASSARTLRVEWSAFSGAPPRATAKW